MKTFDDALKTPGVIPDGRYRMEEGFDVFSHIGGDKNETRLKGRFVPEELRRIADHLDPQPVAASPDPSDAARLNRLLLILQKLKWEQGEDGLVRPVTPADALNDLGLYMLGHEIDMAVERTEADAEIAEACAVFDLRWDADRRAIKRWRASAPGRELQMPDHADLCVWLLEKLDVARREALEEALGLAAILKVAVRPYVSDAHSAGYDAACDDFARNLRGMIGKEHT